MGLLEGETTKCRRPERYLANIIGCMQHQVDGLYLTVSKLKEEVVSGLTRSRTRNMEMSTEDNE